MRDRLSPARLSKALQRQAPLVLEALPRLVERALVEAEQPGARSTAARLTQLEARLEADNRRMRRSVIGATLILAAVGLGGLEAAGFGLPGGPALAGLSGLLGVWSWWRAR